MPIDDRSPNRNYKLPNAGNFLADDVQRLRDALVAIDADVFARYTKTEADQKLADLINGAPGALNTLNELAAAMGNDPNFAATITNALAGKPGFADVWTRTQADARYVQGINQTENTFTGTGSQTTFTLSQTPPTRESLLVTVDGVVQPVSAYTLSGSALILSEAPTSGASIRVLMLGIAGPVQSASTLNFAQAGTGAATRTVESKLRDVVSVKDFGVAGDGVTDDTVAMISAMAHCRNNNKVLAIEGNVVFNAASIPGGASTVDACSMTGAGGAVLTINGFASLSLNGISNTLVEDLKIVTNNRQRSEGDNPGSYVTLFVTASGTKASAVYRNLDFVNNVTSLTGEYRADPLIRETGCQQAVFQNIKASNATVVLTVASSNNVTVDGVVSFNAQTNVYLVSPTNYRVTGCALVNTQQQADYWVGRTFSTPKQINGMDNLLVEQGNNGVVAGLLTTWAIERAAYIQSSNVTVSSCLATNCDGYKVVGNSYASRIKNVYLSECHLDIDDAWTATRGRSSLALYTGYWVSNVHVNSCSLVNTRDTLTNPIGLVGLDSQGGATIDGVYIKNCTAINVAQFVRANMCDLTSAQLTALSPAGSFLVARNVVIESCYYKSAQFRAAGSMYVHRDTDASADAKATYATSNLTVRNNTILLGTAAADRDDWIFDMRYLDGCRCIDNNPDTFFANNGLFGATVTQPHQNIYMREANLRHNLNAGNLVTALSRFNLLKDSTLSFVGASAQGLAVTVSSLNVADGAPSAGLVAIDACGTGYLSIATSSNWAVQMIASGLHYFGRVMSGVKTDQVGTPPVTISAASSNIEIRGDLTPSTFYSAKLTKV